jgi:hypothetical protein
LFLLSMPSFKKSLLSKLVNIVTISAFVMVTSFAPLFSGVATAANLTSMKDTLSPASGAFNAEKAATVANHTIVFTTPTGVANSTTGAIVLTFDNSTSIPVGLTFADIDLDDDGTPITLAGTAGASTYKVVRTSATVLTFDSQTSGTAIAGGSVITIRIGTNATTGGTGTFQITNGSAGTTLLTISGAFGDTGTIGIPIIADDVVLINALVQPSISFSVSDNAIFFGNLRTAGACFAQGTDPGAVTCPQTAEIEALNLQAGTNASSGYIITAQGDTLKSGGNSITALAVNTASSPASEQFGMRINITSGTGTATAPYAASGYAWTPTASTAVQVASATGAPSATTIYSVRYLANIAAVTEAGTYTASHTYVATATY